MIKALSAVVASSVVVVASAAWACGGPPPPPTAGRAGTTVAEASGSLSVFTGTATGYSWDRVLLPGTTRNHLADITGDLSGSVETDLRATTAIAGHGGRVVELSQLAATGFNDLGDDPGIQTTVFGAAFDASSKWQLMTYLPTSQTITLFSVSADGAATNLATLHADCGGVTMLDVVVESDGSLLGLCGPVAVELHDGALVTVQLPVTALAMTGGSNGRAVAYGVGANGSDLVVMTHDATAGWSTSSTIASATAPQVVFPKDETSVVVKQPAGYIAYNFSGGAWSASAPLDGTLPVTSAIGGSPARVLSGQFELTLNSTDGSPNGGWTSTDLGAIGTPPTNPGPTQKTDGFGCSIVGTGIPLALLAAMTLARLRRREAKRV